ncbi:hypothetical protein LSH36_94g00051 [Paralvinella palmiformis]|uniref:Fibrinogen C-terminal domain-containing protein n=1 Tax=Paralvinella palmiformis TaxID=53620 RepID=A0AAD9K1F8_9ANNE|nr:hypothetical protein LSH36_94g00051 [Paralvinella palmiformis]
MLIPNNHQEMYVDDNNYCADETDRQRQSMVLSLDPERESVCPGACPRCDVDHKIRRLLSLIKWACREREQYVTTSPNEWNTFLQRDVCYVSGSGLSVGLLKRKCKFDIHVPSSGSVDIKVVISDPEGRIFTEEITSLFYPSHLKSESKTHDKRYALSLWKIGAAKLLSVPRPGDVAIQNTVNHPPDSKQIAIAYEPVQEGQIRVIYTPTLPGRHVLIVKWHQVHASGSPFRIKIVETLAELNGNMNELRGSTRDLDQVSIDQRLEPLERSADTGSINVDKGEIRHSAVTTAVLNRTKITSEKLHTKDDGPVKKIWTRDERSYCTPEYQKTDNTQNKNDQKDVPSDGHLIDRNVERMAEENLETSRKLMTPKEDNYVYVGDRNKFHKPLMAEKDTNAEVEKAKNPKSTLPGFENKSHGTVPQFWIRNGFEQDNNYDVSAAMTNKLESSRLDPRTGSELCRNTGPGKHVAPSVDKWTQVSNTDTEGATGWVKPTTFLRRRRRPLRWNIDQEQQQSMSGCLAATCTDPDGKDSISRLNGNDVTNNNDRVRKLRLAYRNTKKKIAGILNKTTEIVNDCPKGQDNIASETYAPGASPCLRSDFRRWEDADGIDRICSGSEDARETGVNSLVTRYRSNSLTDDVKDVVDFGVSTSRRKDLLLELDLFSRICSPGVVAKRRSSAPKGFPTLQRRDPDVGLKFFGGSVTRHLESFSSPCYTSSGSPTLQPSASPSDPEGNKTENRYSMSDSQESTDKRLVKDSHDHLSVEDVASEIRTAIDDKQIYTLNASDQDLLDDLNRLCSACNSKCPCAEQTGLLVPDPMRCSAFGAGLKYGMVDAKNIFQIMAPTSGLGYLTVGIMGPRGQVVRETSLTFTGDDLYEVTYDVSQSGTYVIHIKWCDYNIPGSPFQETRECINELLQSENPKHQCSELDNFQAILLPVDEKGEKGEQDNVTTVAERKGAEGANWEIDEIINEVGGDPESQDGDPAEMWTESERAPEENDDIETDQSTVVNGKDVRIEIENINNKISQTEDSHDKEEKTLDSTYLKQLGEDVKAETSSADVYINVLLNVGRTNVEVDDTSFMNNNGELFPFSDYSSELSIFCERLHQNGEMRDRCCGISLCLFLTFVHYQCPRGDGTDSSELKNGRSTLPYSETSEHLESSERTTVPTTLEASEPTYTTSQASEPKYTTSQASKPTTTTLQASKPTTTTLQASEPTTTTKLEQLEMNILRLENKILNERLSSNAGASTDLSHLTNEMANLRSHLVDINETLHELRREREEREGHASDLATITGEQRELHSAELIEAQQSKIEVLTEMIHNHMTVVSQLGERTRFLQEENRVLFEKLLAQSEVMNELMVRLANVTEQQTKQTELLAAINSRMVRQREGVTRVESERDEKMRELESERSDDAYGRERSDQEAKGRVVDVPDDGGRISGSDSRQNERPLLEQERKPDNNRESSDVSRPNKPVGSVIESSSLESDKKGKKKENGKENIAEAIEDKKRGKRKKTKNKKKKGKKKTKANRNKERHKQTKANNEEGEKKVKRNPHEEASSENKTKKAKKMKDKEIKDEVISTPQNEIKITENDSQERTDQDDIDRMNNKDELTEAGKIVDEHELSENGDKIDREQTEQKIDEELSKDNSEESRLGRDCYDHYKFGRRRDMPMKIKPVASHTAIEVFCDMTNGGWTIIQRRFDGTVDFFRDWDQYKKGFGSSTGEFWLGNDNIHVLTNQDRYSLRIEMTDWDRQTAYAEYDLFSVDDETDGYRIHVSGYRGDAGDSLVKHDGRQFSTKDVDNDTVDVEFGGSCARRFHGAWWYYRCYQSSLNGKYYKRGRIPDKRYDGVMWKSWRGSQVSLKKVEMKIRRRV